MKKNGTAHENPHQGLRSPAALLFTAAPCRLIEPLSMIILKMSIVVFILDSHRPGDKIQPFDFYLNFILKLVLRLWAKQYIIQ